MDLDNDDLPVGTVLSRRQALTLLTAPLLARFLGCSASEVEDTDTPLTGSCVVRPELTEGPYYSEGPLLRSDIRTNSATGAARAGVPLVLTFNVSTASGSTCAALEGTVVDVWHCDALGTYSDVGSFSGQDFLRGYQLTDANGRAVITTIYPGWYSGRAVHIHFKVRASNSASAYEFTSQLFFSDSVSREIYSSTAPYSQKGTQDVLNSEDGIYGQSDGQTLVAVTESGDGYAATFNIALEID